MVRDGLTTVGMGGAADVIVDGDVGATFCDASSRVSMPDCKRVAITRANRKLRSGGRLSVDAMSILPLSSIPQLGQYASHVDSLHRARTEGKLSTRPMYPTLRQ
eukprot:6207320-Pleurochrysis_carterae.AAC.1